MGGEGGALQPQVAEGVAAGTGATDIRQDKVGGVDKGVGWGVVLWVGMTPQGCVGTPGPRPRGNSSSGSGQATYGNSVYYFTYIYYGISFYRIICIICTCHLIITVYLPVLPY